MTTVQYLERVARRTKQGLLTSLSLTEQNDVLQAANAALMRLYNALPEYLREQTQGFTLAAPVTLTNISVTAGSTAVSSGVFSPTQIGCSVLIAGDPSYNQILGTSQLRNPYNGPTGVAATVTVYGDALYSTTYPFDRVIGNPTYTNTGQVSLSPMNIGRQNGESNWILNTGPAMPRAWWMQYLGNSQGALPGAVLKFLPFPDQAYPIKIRMSFWPLRLLQQDIQAATTLTVPDQFLETALIPMAVKDLMGTASWNSISKESDAMAIQSDKDAMYFLKDQIADPAAPANGQYCPIGF